MKQKKIPLYLAFTIPLTLQVIGIVSLVGYLSYRSGQKAVENIAYQLTTETGNYVNQKLESYLSLPHRINQSQIAAVESGAITLDNLEALHRYLILQHGQFPEITSLHLGTPAGNFKLAHRVSSREIEAGMTKIKAHEIPIEAGSSDPNQVSDLNLYAIDNSGKLDRYLVTIKNIDVRDRPWYRQAQATGQPGWTDPFQIGASSLLAINAYAPFYDSSQALKGVFSVNLSLEALSEFLSELSVSQKGEIFIIERNGLLIAQSDGTLPYKASPPPDQQPEPGKVQFQRRSGKDSSNPLIQKVIQQLENQFGGLSFIQSSQQIDISLDQEAFQEERAFSTVTSYQDEYGLDWLIVTVIPESELMGEIQKNVRNTVGLCGLALVGSLGFSWWSSRRIARSLSQLSQASQKIVKGDLSPPLPPTTIQEVETLSQSFSQMVQYLEEADTLRDNYEMFLEREVEQTAIALKEAQHIAKVGSWEYNFTTGKVTWSKQLYRIYEAEDQEPVSRPNQTIEQIHPDDQHKYRKEVLSAIETGQPFNTDLKIITKKGNIRYIQAKGQPVKDFSNGDKRFSGTVIDITERKQAEIALQQTTQELEAFLENAPAAITVFEPQGRYLQVNYAAAKWLGSSASEIVGKTFADFFPDAVVETFLSRINTLLATRESLWVEDEGIIEGEQKAFETILFPIFDRQGKVEKIGAIASDITQRKQAETELISAKNVAEAAAQAKSEFLATMSHEIRTPMNGVIGMLSLLQDTPLTQEQRSRLNMASSSAESLLSLINDILDFSKVEAGKLQLETIEFNLREHLENLGKTMAFKAQEKGLELILDLQHLNSTTVKGDPSRIRQILTNLVGNAIKFTEQGEIIIQASLSREGETLCLTGSVTDTGIGIPQDKLNALFNPFTQVDSSTTRQYGGTGLGLAIVKKLCELMGGTITVESELGKGSCFRFNLQLELGSDTEDVSVDEFSGLTVLLIEPQTSNRQLLSRQLEAWGVNVLSAEDGQTALSMSEASQRSIQLVIINSYLPDFTATALIQRLQKTPLFQTVPIVLMTLMSEQIDGDYTTYLNKPIAPSDLLEALKLTANKGFASQMRRETPQVNQPTPTSDSLSSQARLLLVEDNQVNRMVIQGMLKKLGLAVEVATNGTEALQALQQAARDSLYDLILMDCQMPEMDGYEATRQIRAGIAGKNYQNIPIIAMTAYAMQGDREKCLTVGMDDYMSKPINFQTVKEIMEKWLAADATVEFEQAVNPIVFQTLVKVVGDDPEALHEIIESFRDDLQNSLSAIVRYAQKRELYELKQAIHTLKGTSATMGALQLRDQCNKIEIAIQQGDFPSSEMIKQLQLESEKVMRVIAQRLN